MLLEWCTRKKPSVLGLISGSITGLVVITPACGFVDMTGAIIMGLVGGCVCLFAVRLKHRLGYDDALDAFGVHGVGGALGGALLLRLSTALSVALPLVIPPAAGAAAVANQLTLSSSLRISSVRRFSDPGRVFREPGRGRGVRVGFYRDLLHQVR